MTTVNYLVQPNDGFLKIARSLSPEGITDDQADAFANQIAIANGLWINSTIHPGRILFYYTEWIPEPAPPVDRVYDLYGFRKGHPHSTKAVEWIERTGRDPATMRFRNVIAHTETQSGVPMFSAATSTANAYWSSPTHDMNLGVRYPQMATVTIFPGITKPSSGQESAATRTQHWRDVLAGRHDAKYNQILAAASQVEGVVHRFCLNSEPDLSSWAYTKHGIDPALWAEAFDYIADKIHAAGHLVVYAHNGSMFQASPDSTKLWWEYAMPSLDSFDSIGMDCFINTGANTPEKRLGEAWRAYETSVDIGKKVGYPEWGVTQNVFSDDVAIGFMSDFCDQMADMDDTLDHFDLWDDNDRQQTDAMEEWALERFGVTA